MNVRGRGQESSKELLDNLTKEEKEELITKKMEEIRRKNEALEKRYGEIEADKKRAEQMEKSERRKSGSPRKEFKDFKTEMDKRYDTDDHRQRGANERDWGHDDRDAPPRGDRHRDDNHQRDDNRHREDTRRQMRRPDQPDLRNKIRGNEGRIGSGRFDHSQQNQNRRSGNFEQRGRQSDHDNRPRSGNFEDSRRGGGGGGDRRSGNFGGTERQHGAMGSHDAHFESRPGNRVSPQKKSSGRGQRLASMTKEKLQAQDYGAKRKENAAKYEEELKSPNGPPPEPGYSFLADPRRQGPLDNNEASRRHASNFGGKDFSGVKNKIKQEKDRGRFSGPPRSKMEMSVRMTGRERQEYQQWKEERDRIDQERIQRQKDNTGNWVRSWDSEKVEQESKEPPSPRQVPAPRRPVGRIGSGRFDHSNVNSRQRGETSASNRDTRVPPSGKDHDSKPVRRTRFSSSGSEEGRVVEQQNDSIVVKIDNELASPSDKRPQTKVIRQSQDRHAKHGRKKEKQVPTKSSEQSESQSVSVDEPNSTSEGGNKGQKVTFDIPIATTPQDDDEWEDVAEDHEFYDVHEKVDDVSLSEEVKKSVNQSEDNQVKTGNDESVSNSVKNDTTLQLNVPTSSETSVSDGTEETGLHLDTEADPQVPTTPEIKTPVGHVKVLDWGSAMDDMSDGSRSNENSPRDDVVEQSTDEAYEIPREAIEEHLRASRERELEVIKRASQEKEVTSVTQCASDETVEHNVTKTEPSDTSIGDQENKAEGESIRESKNNGAAPEDSPSSKTLSENGQTDKDGAIVEENV